MIKTKNLFLISLSLLGLLFLSGCFGVKISDNGKPFNTAIIHYKWDGVKEGKETVYISGGKIRSEISTTTTVGGVQTEQNRIIINNGENIYKIDPEKKLALKQASPFKGDLASMSPQEKKDMLSKLALGLNKEDSLPKANGEETIIEKKCKIYSVTGKDSTCIWEGIILRNEIVIDGGKAIQKAISLEENVNIDEAFFQVPQEITIEEQQG